MSSIDQQQCLSGMEVSHGPIDFSSKPSDQEMFNVADQVEDRAEIFKRQYQNILQQIQRPPMHPDVPFHIQQLQQQQQLHHHLQQQFLMSQHLQNVASSQQESSPEHPSTPPSSLPVVNRPPMSAVAPTVRADSAPPGAGRERTSGVDVGYISDRSSSCSPQDNCQRPSHHHRHSITPPIEKKMRLEQEDYGHSSSAQVASSSSPPRVIKSPKLEFSPQPSASMYSRAPTTASTTDTVSNRSLSPKLEIEEDRPDSSVAPFSPPVNRNIISPSMPVMPGFPPLAAFSPSLSGLRSPELFKALMSAAMHARTFAGNGGGGGGGEESGLNHSLMPPLPLNFPSPSQPQDLDPTRGGPGGPVGPCSPPRPPQPPGPRQGQAELRMGSPLGNNGQQITDPAVFMEVAKVDAESKGEFERFKMSVMQKFEDDDKKSSRRNSLDSQPLKITEEMLKEGKDAAYYERRRKNNEAAKRSRDSRRQKEQEVAIRCQFLERENASLKYQLALERVKNKSND